MLTNGFLLESLGHYEFIGKIDLGKFGLIFTVLAVALISSTCFAQKLGHLNSQAIMLEMPDYESAKKELELFRTEKTKELEMYQKLFQESLQTYEQEKGTLTEDARKRKDTTNKRIH